MTTFSQTKKILLNQKPFIKDRYKVKDIGLFGSYAKGQQKKTSDIDILVEFSQPVGFFTFLDLEDYLTKKLGVKVDLVTKKALKAAIGQYILSEVSYI